MEVSLRSCSKDYFDKELPPVRRFRACFKRGVQPTDATDAEQRHADC